MILNDVEQQKEHFDKVAARYQKAIEQPSHVIIANKIWKKLLSSISPSVTGKMTVLDAMCGNAYLYDKLCMFLPGEFEYHGFDYSEEMLASVRGKYSGVIVWKQDVTTFIRENTYDIILIAGGLHHVHAHLEMVLSNVYASLKSGGLFINLEPTHGNSAFGLIRSYIYKNNELMDQDTEKGFFYKELTDAITSHGFMLKKQFYPGLIAYALWYLPGLIHPLAVGSPKFVEKFVDLESTFWSGRVARFFSFATASIYQK